MVFMESRLLNGFKGLLDQSLFFDIFETSESLHLKELSETIGPHF